MREKGAEGRESNRIRELASLPMRWLVSEKRERGGKRVGYIHVCVLPLPPLPPPDEC